jgi:hypothetical protein
LTEQLYVPEAGGTAEYDVVLWGWRGAPDPDFLLSLLTSAEIGGWSDSSYANTAYDALFERQRQSATPEARQAVVREMVDLVYDDAPYHVLFYDDELHARRIGRFEGWSTQPPAGGVSLFAHGVGGYLDLAPATEASPAPADTAPAAPTPAAVPSAEVLPGVLPPPGAQTAMLVAILAIVVVLGLALIARRARRRSAP